MQVHIKDDKPFIDMMDDVLQQEGEKASWEHFQMAYTAAKETNIDTFTGLVAPGYLPHMTFHPHQLEASRRVVEEMNGRAILADEVGLGKTIEAGLVLKELMIRGLVKKVLLLVPASLVNQWVNELNSKFHIPAASQRKQYIWEHYDVIVSSIDLAKRSPHREIILEQDYDFVLIDEAHKLKNSQTKNYAFIQSLKKKYCLLLTATPVQNKLSDIYNLVSLLKPGYLGSYKQFKDTYGDDRRDAEEHHYLKELIRKVMVRNRREETGLQWTKRKVETIWIDFTEQERQVYENMQDSTSAAATFAKITLLRELCSSREAAYLSMKKMVEENPETGNTYLPVMKEIEKLPQHSKALKVVELIKAAPPGEKFIIFTEYRATQFYLQWTLKQHDISSVPFRGGFKAGKKDWMRELFEKHAQVLIATEAGGEGINLQFCSNMINYDLPWNPMRLEQRIGRIHRFGQKKDVQIFNFAVRNTLEAHILELLYKKINLFERVIGNLDHILAELQVSDVEKEIKRIFADSRSEGEIKVKLDNLTAVITETGEQLERDKLHG
ncbi:DEAD/DEAH box helicase [Terribacillus saccharophilus]|uniref:ATP-dependent helicase n=1 Tax=Terribacillus saccharophilus TaxID=361277 RepID=A0A075LQP5_9BACI|nr:MULTISPECIES: SNF2-related protein [Terribacillus]AIF66783.1 ATP-dependent helicase [Terribacillus goriensis]MCM3224507.1 DEAD/DEAH box helicase [Terribacillus saccharophilus]MEC0283597.1 SNF2-related protein [Terribacillus saccharophilus]MEC0290553.1 SNF2-related protein [Terribacillus saccharophilus]